MKPIMRLFILLVSVFFVGTSTVSAAAADTELNLIRAGGEATQVVVPDTAFLNFGVTAEGKTVSEAKEKSAEIVRNVFRTLAMKGIADENIQTVGFNLQPLYKESGKAERELRGYALTYNLNVKISALDTLDNTVDAVLAAGTNTFNGVTFTLNNKTSVERSLLAAAVQNARAKAAIVAEAGGRRLGILVSANVGNIGGFEYQERNMDAMLAAGVVGKSAAIQLQPGTMKITAYVDAAFSLE